MVMDGRELFGTKKKPPDQRQEVSTATICGCCRYIRRSRLVQVITAEASPMWGRALPLKRSHVLALNREESEEVFEKTVFRT
jgi:hypothetical protein